MGMGIFVSVSDVDNDGGDGHRLSEKNVVAFGM